MALKVNPWEQFGHEMAKDSTRKPSCRDKELKKLLAVCCVKGIRHDLRKGTAKTAACKV